MIRILQLLDRHADFETRRGAEGLARSLGEGFAVETKTIGYGGDWRDVATGAAKLRRHAGARFDVIHAWGGVALTVAALGSTRPIVFSPAADSRPRMVRWLRAVMDYRDVQVVCPTATLRRRFVEHGVPLGRCHLIRPGVEFARVRRRRDDALRAALGFREDDHVLLACGESTRAAAHADATWAAGILHVADPKYRLLIWGRGESAPPVRRLAEKWGQADLLRVAESRLGRQVEFEELLPATDTIVVPARGPVATLPIAIAMASGLPIVAAVTATVSELLEDRHTALMTQPGKPRHFARRILDLIEDPSLQWSIADMARTEAFEFFAFTRFVNQFRQVYRQVAEGAAKVEVPEAAPGAGMRFHGRG
jgi:glycosyltransferase involved in cell wall biosynthesis